MRNTLLKTTMAAAAAALIIATIPPELSKCLQSEGLAEMVSGTCEEINNTA